MADDGAANLLAITKAHHVYKSKRRVASSIRVGDYIFFRVLFYNTKSGPSIFVTSTETSADTLIPQKLVPLLALGYYLIYVWTTPSYFILSKPHTYMNRASVDCKFETTSTQQYIHTIFHLSIVTSDNQSSFPCQKLYLERIITSIRCWLLLNWSRTSLLWYTRLHLYLHKSLWADPVQSQHNPLQNCFTHYWKI